MHTPYQVTKQDLESHGTLTMKDIGRWYLVITGCLIFCENKKAAQQLAAQLEEDERTNPNLNRNDLL